MRFTNQETLGLFDLIEELTRRVARLEAAGRSGRKPGCQCQWEEGDSECPVHDMPAPADKAPPVEPAPAAPPDDEPMGHDGGPDCENGEHVGSCRHAVSK